MVKRKDFINFEFVKKEIFIYGCLLVLLIPSNIYSQTPQETIVAGEIKYKELKESKSNNSDSLIREHIKLIDKLDNKSTNIDELNLIISISDRLSTLQRHRVALDYLTPLNERSDLSEKIKTRLHSTIGYVFQGLRAYSLSNKYIHLSLTLQDTVINNRDRIYKYSTIGTNHLMLNQFDSASYYFKKQYLIALEYNDLNAIVNSLNNTGWSFLQQSITDSSLHYFKKSIEFIYKNDLIQEQDSFMMHNIHGNIGMNYQKMNVLDSAIFYLEKDFNYNLNKQRDPSYLFVVSKELIKIHLIQGNTSSALYYLNLAEIFSKSFSQKQLRELISLQLMYRFHNDKENDKISSFITLIDAEFEQVEENQKVNNNIIANFLLDEAKLKNKLQNSELEKKNFELTIANQNKNRLIMVSLFIGFSLLLSIVILILFRRQSRLKTELLNESKNKLEFDLRLKNQDVTDLAISINQKQEYNKEVLKKLQKIRSVDEKELKQKLNTLILELKSINTIDKSKENFQENLDVINTAFFVAIKEKHPDLTKKEKELCALIRLKLSNKEIATIKNTTLNSVKVAKYRLKTKLSLSDHGAELIDYLSGF